jgi:hypothetical protein
VPLSFTAIKCRHSQVRRKAIALLRSANRQEGIWNSLLTATVIERLMDIEEDELSRETPDAASIPKWKRVLGVEIRLDSENRRANLKYLKLREDGTRDKVEEWIEWFGLGTK